MKKPIQIAIADDHKLMRDGLISLLNEFEDDVKVLFEVDNGKELLHLLKAHKPDIILLDIEMPVMNGKEALEKILIRYPKMKVVMISQYFTDAYIVDYIKNGACGFLPKSCSVDKILDALYAVQENGCYYDNKVSAAMADLLKKTPKIENTELDTSFTKQEIKIIKLICQKKSNQEIAEELHLSVRTIEGHRYNICKKTKTNNSMDLIEYAIKGGILNV